MKKKILSILLAILTFVSLFTLPVNAASYPLVLLSTTDSETTNAIPYGEVGTLKFMVLREYNNEKLNVEVYNSSGDIIASTVCSYGSSSGYMVDQSITLNTKKLGMSVGTYTVKYWMEFYTYFEWRTAPKSYTAKIKVIKNVCNGNHKMTFKQVITTGDCETDGCHRYECSKCDYYMYKDVKGEHKYSAWNNISDSEHQRKCSICSNIETGSHKWNNGVVKQIPTENSEGIKVYTCTTCSAVKEKIIYLCANNEHTYDNACDKDCNECGTLRSVGDHKNHYVTTNATLAKNGTITYKCSICGKIASQTTIYYPKTFKLSATSYTYSGSSKKPTVKVYDSAGKLVSSSNYKVDYKNNKYVGKATITVKFKGKYSGTKTLNFTITPKSTKVSKLTAGAKSLKVSIKKQSSQTTGYEIQYSTSKKFTSAKTKNVTSYKMTAVTLKSLKAKKTYYVRVRTYKTVSGKKYYSGWSTYKSKKTK